MNSTHEKKLRQAIAKAIAKEAGKNAEKVVEFSTPLDQARFEKLVQIVTEKAMAPQQSSEPKPDSTVIPFVFRAPPHEGPFHFKVSGMEKTFRESIAGKDIGESVNKNLTISIEFVQRF